MEILCKMRKKLWKVKRIGYIKKNGYVIIKEITAKYSHLTQNCVHGGKTRCIIKKLQNFSCILMV